MRRFRSGTIVYWTYGKRRIYGTVLRFNQTKYSIQSLAGDVEGKNGRKWSCSPGNITYVPRAKVPDEVCIAIAAFALTGKVPSGER